MMFGESQEFQRKRCKRDGIHKGGEKSKKKDVEVVVYKQPQVGLDGPAEQERAASPQKNDGAECGGGGRHRRQISFVGN